MIALRNQLAAGGLTLAIGSASLIAQPAPTPTPVPVPTPPGGTTTAPSGPGRFFHYDELITRGDEEPVVIHTGPTPELHVVRRGDTLWDICWYYFSDPWQWPKVWSYNGQITNPHWIYPGDLVRLLPRGFLIGTPTVDPGLEPDATPTGPTVVVPPSTPVDVRLRQTAFVDQDELDTSMIITGAVEDKVLLAEGDEVFVTYPADRIPAVGSRFSIYAEDEQVNHPKKGGKVGSYVHVLGELEITAVKLDKLAQGRIVASTGEIERGSRVGPLQRQFKAVPPIANEVELQRTIVARLSRSQLIGTGEVVFIDVGQGDGAKVGNRMFVVRRGDALPGGTDPDALIGQDDRDFPARALGRVILLDVGKEISVGLVDRSVEEMGVGDLVIMRKEVDLDDDAP